MEHKQITEMVTAVTTDVFRTMLDMEVFPGEHYVEKGSTESYDGLVALVGIAGGWTGIGSVFSSSGLAMKVTSKMFMVDVQSVNLEVLDAMSELANMIIGNFKSLLEAELGPLGLSIPTVIYGRNYRALSGGAKERVVMPFECEGEKMEIKICLVDSRESGSHHRISGVVQVS